MTRLPRKVLTALGLALAAAASTLTAACDTGGGGGGGSFFIRSCSLGCNSGANGSQIICAIVNTFENQEIAVEFSAPVDLSSVNAGTFRIVDVLTGQVPNGTFLLDPTNKRRVIFRPQLSINAQGNVTVGFKAGASYQINIPGTLQGDTGPFVQSASGKSNETRLLCTITTDQGLADPVPGPPSVATFVEVRDPVTGGKIPNVPAPGATNVASDSTITLVFNDLMNIGSLVVPSTGASPSILVLADADGDTTDPADQVPIEGTFTFSVDLIQLTTTVVFTPTNGLPNGGSSTPKRKVIVDVLSSAIDLVSNPVANPGPRVFEPESFTFSPETLNEDFASLSTLQADQSGAGMWSQPLPGGLTGTMVGKGVGGGSGRLGKLTVNNGDTVTLLTGPVPASAHIDFLDVPCSGESFEIDGQTFTFSCAPSGPNDLPIINSKNPALNLPLTVDEAARLLNQRAWSQGVTFTAQGGNRIDIVANTPGTIGNSFQLVPPTGSLSSDTSLCTQDNLCQPLSGVPPAPAVITSSFTLVGGADGTTFQPGTLLDNFDFQSNPGGIGPPITVTDGVFEFSSIEVDTGGRLVLTGPNPARLFARGRIDVKTNGRVELFGQGPGIHDSTLPDGQNPVAAGPNGGIGGRGGDRPDTPSPGFETLAEPSFPNPGAVADGSPGTGVGLGSLAGGVGGSGWPITAPTSASSFGDWGLNKDPSPNDCTSFKVPGPGSGGGYALDGSAASPMVPVMFDDSTSTATPLPSDGTASPRLNTVDVDADGITDTTPGGDSTALGIEPPTAPPVVRTLDPDMGYLRGGSGGGGGGRSTYGSSGSDLFNPGSCDPFASFIFSVLSFPSHSGAAGGSGGGALQAQAGESLNLSGLIDASGGDGGDGQSSTDPSLQVQSLTGQAAPAGGGSGGAILLQAHTFNVSTIGGLRLDVAGGTGGSATVSNGIGMQDTTGGDGGPGLVRVEDTVGLVFGPSIAAVLNPMLPNTSEDILSVGQSAFDLRTSLPRSFQGAQSCWLRPPTTQGLFFALSFLPDGAVLGWDATLVVDFGSGPQEVSYRDPAQNGGLIPAGQSFQQFWGDLLNRELGPGQMGAPIVFRFEGAKALTSITDFCAVDDSPASVQLLGLTPWVRNPEELNAFQPPPDMVRFTIVFDESHPDAGKVLGVSNVRIETQPD